MPTTEKLPRTVTSLIKARAPGWTHRVITGTGHVERQRNDPDQHRRLTSMDPCTSLSLRLRHDDGRAAVGVWLRMDGATSWTFESAWRWLVCRDQACTLAGVDHPNHEMPIQIDSATLSAWLTVPSVAAFAAAEAGIAARKANAAKKAAATRAAKKQAAGTEISTSAPTEIHSPLLMEVA